MNFEIKFLNIYPRLYIVRIMICGVVDVLYEKG